jgi:hypothetical protein
MRSRNDASGLHDRRDEIILRVIANFDPVAEVLEQLGASVAVRLLDRLFGLAFQTDDELRLGNDAGFSDQANGLLILLDRGLFAEEIELHLRGSFSAERDVQQAGFAVEREQIGVAAGCRLPAC